MVKAALLRRINRRRADTHVPHDKLPNNSPNPLSTPHSTAPRKDILDNDGFTIILSKKEKNLLRRSNHDELTLSSKTEPSRMDEVDDVRSTDPITSEIGDLEDEEYETDRQSTVSKSWVRKQLRVAPSGGICKATCIKRQRDLLRRVVLHTRLQLQAQTQQLSVTGPVHRPHSSSGPPASATGNSRSVNCLDFVKQWAKQTGPTTEMLSKGKGSRNRKKRSKNRDKNSNDSGLHAVSDKPLKPLKIKSNATEQAIKSFQTMLQKF
ncbi:unnamed protein product [Calicophoron daubneyi]|uniref:Uncharacterized protein n=1 Tax=Calicophoron daubneyi TaxID=300641 RepID=A0AAV2TUI4_CALDB